MGGAEGGTALADYLAAPGALHEVDRGLEKLQVLLVVRCVCAVDLDPFPRAGHTAGLERGDVLPGKLQLGRDGDGQAQAHAVGADAGEHLVADEIGVQPADLPGADARELEEHCVDLCLAAGLGCLGLHGRAWVVLHRTIESQTPGVRCAWRGREKAAAACEYGGGLGRSRRVEANDRAGLGRGTYMVLPANCSASKHIRRMLPFVVLACEGRPCGHTAGSLLPARSRPSSPIKRPFEWLVRSETCRKV